MTVVNKKRFVVADSDNDQYYQTWRSILVQPTMQQLNPNTAKLLDAIAQIGYQHANSKDAYKRDISRYFFLWGEKVQSMSSQPSKNEPQEVLSHYAVFTATSKKTTFFIPQSCYTKGKVLDLQAKSLERQFSKYMKRVIPLSYAISFAIFLSLSVIFGFTFYNGLHGGSYFIGLWTNLMLLIAAAGLTITVFAACSEWRRWHSGLYKENERGEKAGEKHRRGE